MYTIKSRALFVTPNSSRLIHGSSNIYFETNGPNNTPVIYLGQKGVQSPLVLHLILLLLQHLAKSSNTTANSNNEEQFSLLSFNPKNTTKKTKEEVLEWLSKNGHESITADELRTQMGISTRNLNDLGGINILKDEAFGTKSTRRGRKCNITHV